ncbi:MAG TPA: alpha-glucan family phosphorylase [Rhodothermales bacterium]
MTTREKLQELAANMWWSWNRQVLELYRELNPATFSATSSNPTATLAAADTSVLERPDFQAKIDAAYNAFRDYLARPPQIEGNVRVSYFCMEYGLHESLPIYSGGLGILAGDHAKAASDLGIPFTAVGLFLREGYFEQHFTPDGWQKETFTALNPADHAVTLVRKDDGSPLLIEVTIGSVPVHVQAWRIDLGKTRMYLLDTDLEQNSDEIRSITRRLYQGGRETRIKQEIILGIAGVRLLRALRIQTDVYHLNEGHCAFLLLELLRERIAAGDSIDAAEEAVRRCCVFTTHTPVIAGHDRFNPDLLLHELGPQRVALGMTEEQFLSYGRVKPSDPHEAYTMTVLALKLSRHSNGVSRLNGEVARLQWQELYPDRPAEQVPISHITNGVHLATWSTATARAFLDEHFGRWKELSEATTVWNSVYELDDEVLWRYRTRLRHELIEFLNEYVPRQSLPQTLDLDPEALTIGFARRFATYKRAPLLFHDFQRIARIFNRADRPIQVIYSGKAHPADEGGKQFIQTIFRMTEAAEMRGRLVFVENYNMKIGRMLTSGCDVWLNNPRRPMEASGTSGQKVCIHGGLNLSILDGWWPEGFNGRNGWAIGYDSSSNMQDMHQQDREDARYLYDTLEFDVIPAFYERDDRRIPVRWVQYMRNAFASLANQFSGQRMVAEYYEKVYRT